MGKKSAHYFGYMPKLWKLNRKIRKGLLQIFLSYRKCTDQAWTQTATKFQKNKSVLCSQLILRTLNHWTRKNQSCVPGNGRMAVSRDRKFRNQKNGKNKHSKSWFGDSSPYVFRQTNWEKVSQSLIDLLFTLELVSKELYHLVAILQHYAGSLISKKRNNVLFTLNQTTHLT